MKDSQPPATRYLVDTKYIKANNERFSTVEGDPVPQGLSISRRIMKDSQRKLSVLVVSSKYIKANNERFSTRSHAQRWAQ